MFNKTHFPSTPVRVVRSNKKYEEPCLWSGEKTADTTKCSCPASVTLANANDVDTHDMYISIYTNMYNFYCIKKSLFYQGII